MAVSLAIAKEISVDAAVTPILPELDGKEEQTTALKALLIGQHIFTFLVLLSIYFQVDFKVEVKFSEVRSLLTKKRLVHLYNYTPGAN